MFLRLQSIYFDLYTYNLVRRETWWDELRKRQLLTQIVFYFYHCIYSAVPVFRSLADRPHNMNVTEGDTVNITCNPVGEPAATITWLKNGSPLSGWYWSCIYCISILSRATVCIKIRWVQQPTTTVPELETLVGRRFQFLYWDVITYCIGIVDRLLNAD